MTRLTCAEALATLLDQVDYTSDPPACRLNEMVAAVLPREIIVLCREALAAERATKTTKA
jgi:hypothetical protein